MARKSIDIGIIGNDGTGDSIRDSFRKVNDNFRELYSSLGLGDRLTFTGLDETPETYVGQENAILSVNSTEDGLSFRKIEAGIGIQIDYSNDNSIVLNNLLSDISGDDRPNLGGPLNAQFGAIRSPIGNLPNLSSSTETALAKSVMQNSHGLAAADTNRLASNKGYTDRKLDIAGVDAIDPATNAVDSSFGIMTGPLVLSRDPVPEDDDIWEGRVAATKRYVDNSGFSSSVNLYVATSGSDNRTNIGIEIQGRALPFAFRTLEAALQRAEELVLESPIAIGPYKKVLTYNNGAGECTLSAIGIAEETGNGLSTQLFMSVDTIKLSNKGSLYLVGDIISVLGGTFSQAAAIRVLSVNVISGTGGRGSVSTFSTITAGVYTSLPGSINVATSSTSEFGTNATLILSYKVNNIQVLDGGDNYGLVSVRIEGGGGGGAFGTANVVSGSIASITVNASGSGFSSLPNVIVNLPRFFIETFGFRTDFTGNVNSSTPDAIRTRDIREGLLLRGETSGAIAQILGHTGSLSLDSETVGSEIFDVDLLSGEFIIGESISYGDETKPIQLSIFIESGIYEENLPLRVPQNVAIIGDEFRRTIIRPRPAVPGAPLSGMSTSPWAFIRFRRDSIFDGMQVTSQAFGYHYLQESTLPVYPRIENTGNRFSASVIIRQNKEFITSQMVGWILHQIENEISPFTAITEVDTALRRQDIEILLDAIAFDLKYNGYARTVSTAIKYYSSAIKFEDITVNLSQTIAIFQRLNVVIQLVISATPITDVYTSVGQLVLLGDSESIFPSQLIDPAFVTEVGSSEVVLSLVSSVIDIVGNSTSANYPKLNKDMDVFLCNDATIIRAVTCQGHGGFMMVLDPEGQILTKSPYCQESASFSQSVGRKAFRGGILVDGFTGNQEFRILSVDNPTRLTIDGLLRIPQTPCSFIVNDAVYRINYVRNFTYGIDFPSAASEQTSQWYSSAQFILDETTPWTRGLFTYDRAIYVQDISSTISGVGDDIVFNTNFHRRKLGYNYYQRFSQETNNNTVTVTANSISILHTYISELISNSPISILNEVASSNNVIRNALEVSLDTIPQLILTNPPGSATSLVNAKQSLLLNISFIQQETIGQINSLVLSNTTPYSSTFSYNELVYSREIGRVVEAVIYDLLYGGNSQSRAIVIQYFNGIGDGVVPDLVTIQRIEFAQAIAYVNYLCQQIIQDLDPVVAYSNAVRIPGITATSSELSIIDTLLTNVSLVVQNGLTAIDLESLPDLTIYEYDVDRLAANTLISSNSASLTTRVISWINFTANQYEVLMPGNRSMLSNDYTQVNDLGYGLAVANGGLTEAVSLFTYYCHISYYASTGGQIRSIGGSSSYGNYGLVAENSDPLEIPTPVSLYRNLSQGATVLADIVSRQNAKSGTDIWVTFDDYLPLNGSEIEILHNNLFTRYSVVSVSLVDANLKIVRLSLSSAGGLEAGVPDGQRVTIRMNSFVVLTGDVVDVATRPSTALLLNDSPTVYRILEFNDYDDTFDLDLFVISDIDLSSSIITTAIPHKQLVGFQIKFTLAAGDTIPAGIIANEETPFLVVGEIYFIRSVIDEFSFTISLTKSGPIVDLTLGPAFSTAGQTAIVPYGLALTQLRENYNYISMDVYALQPFQNPTGLSSCIFTASDPTVVSSASHGLLPGTQLRFASPANVLPTGIMSTSYYWVVSTGIAADEFKITNSPPITSTELGVKAALTGTTITGLVSTSRIIPGQRLVEVIPISVTSVSGNGSVAIAIFSQQRVAPFNRGQVVEITGVVESAFDKLTAIVISCTTTSLEYESTAVGASVGGTIFVIATGSLGSNPVVLSIVNPTTIVIATDGGESNGSVVFNIEGLEIGASTTGINVQFGVLVGDQGQNTIAITDLPAGLTTRVLNSVFVYKGTNYSIIDYQSRPNGVLYSLITLNRPLDVSAISFQTPIVLKSGVLATSSGAAGTLTIRISLVRVTSHDFLEIGTGGYADTNYPNEIYGSAVNDFNTVPVYSTSNGSDGSFILRSQVQERDVGRVFFVTTDQYGNFSVGPFFKVDQGTGTVTFSASIALSQLDGLGFKRGTTISEFSVDDSMADAANDTVPTEAAVRGYVDRRLGISHIGVPLLSENLIPAGVDGGYMSLTGVLPMKGNMNMGGFTVTNVGTPTALTDLARLIDITIDNLTDIDGSSLFNFSDTQSGQLLALTGDRNIIGNFTPTGDVIFDITAGDSTISVIRTSISPNVIVNANINTAADIAQSKLLLSTATTRASPVGISQSDRGIISVDSAVFTATDGWVSLVNNGVSLSKLVQLSARSVLGNPTSVAANVSPVTMISVVDIGGAIKKTQFSSGTGFIKRINPISGAFTDDAHYSLVTDDTNKSASTLIRRDANGDFASRIATLDQLNLSTTSTGSYSAIRSNELSAVSGYTELFGYGGGGGSIFPGVQIGAGTANNRTLYNNSTHEFRSQVGTTSFATLDSSGFNIGVRTLTAGALTTGSDTTVGTITGQWILASAPGATSRGNSRLQATYAADLAEFYEGDLEYETGTVLIFGGSKEVTTTTIHADSRVAGVVSNNAAYSMNGACPGLTNQIALQGRVPVKVIGRINKGDILVTSSLPGVAIVAGTTVAAGTMVGKALESYDSKEIGIIEVAVGRT